MIFGVVVSYYTACFVDPYPSMYYIHLYKDDNIKRLYKKITTGAYKIPHFLSPYAKDLLRNILHIDPEKRYDINNIMNHQWCQMGRPKLDRGILVGTDKMPIDIELVKNIKEHYYRDKNITLEQLVNNIEKNYHNNITTT